MPQPRTPLPLPTPQDVLQAALPLGRQLTPAQQEGLACYLGLLQTWNRKTNLVGPARWQDMLAELVADSWSLADLLAEVVTAPAPLSLDFGAGAGIPGVPLRLFWNTGDYVLIEPRAKRAAFLRQCLAQMRLGGAQVFEGRTDAYRLPAGRACADVFVSRAYKPWPEFLQDAARLAGPGSLAVVFANAPEPDGPAPQGFSLRCARPYPSRGKTGYFWVFSSNM